MNKPNGLMIIGIHGKKRAGKDSICDVLKYELQNVVRVAFADAVYEEVAKACGVTVEYIRSNKELFRPMLQWWGTDFRRTMKGKSYWINLWLEKVNSLPIPACVIIPDVRFENEADVIKECGGILITVIRPGQVNTDTHSSETSLDNYKKFDYAVINNGTLAELKQNIIKLLNNICISHKTLRHWRTHPMDRCACSS